MSVQLGAKWASLAEDNRKLKCDMESVTERLMTTERLIDEKRIAVDKLSEENMTLKEQLQEKSTLLEAAYAENRKLRADLKLNREMYAEVEDSLDLKTQQLTDAKDNLDTQTKTSAKLAEMVACKDLTISDLNKKNSCKHEENEKLFKELDSFRKASAQKDAKIAALVERVASDSHKLVSMRAALDLERASNRGRNSKHTTPIISPIFQEQYSTKKSALVTPNPWE